MDWIDETLADLRRAGLLRELRPVDSPPGPEMVVDGRRVIQFASNDYLCLAGDARLAEAATGTATGADGADCNPAVFTSIIE